MLLIYSYNSFLRYLLCHSDGFHIFQDTGWLIREGTLFPSSLQALSSPDFTSRHLYGGNAVALRAATAAASSHRPPLLPQITIPVNGSGASSHLPCLVFSWAFWDYIRAFGAKLWASSAPSTRVPAARCCWTRSHLSFVFITLT